MFFWNSLLLNGGGVLMGVLGDVINVKWGLYDVFKEVFMKVVVGMFGLGWVWFVKKVDGLFDIVLMSNVVMLLMIVDKVLLMIDVWEYVYYIDYCNVCLKFVEVFWNIVNWDFVVKNFV